MRRCTVFYKWIHRKIMLSPDECISTGQYYTFILNRTSSIHVSLTLLSSFFIIGTLEESSNLVRTEEIFSPVPTANFCPYRRKHLGTCKIISRKVGQFSAHSGKGLSTQGLDVERLAGNHYLCRKERITSSPYI